MKKDRLCGVKGKGLSQKAELYIVSQICVECHRALTLLKPKASSGSKSTKRLRLLVPANWRSARSARNDRKRRVHKQPHRRIPYLFIGIAKGRMRAPSPLLSGVLNLSERLVVYPFSCRVLTIKDQRTAHETRNNDAGNSKHGRVS